MKKNNLIYFISILIVPALIVLYRSYITKLFYFSDPDYAYILNGLNINIFKLPYYSDHPGVPFTIFIAIGLRLIYWFSGHNLDIQSDVLTNPEYYEWWLHWMLFSTIILSTILLGIFVYKKTRNISLAIAMQSIPFLFDTSLELLSTRLMPDVMLIFVLQIFIALIISYYNKANTNKSTKTEEFLFPIVLGFGMAIKIIILPMLIFPLLLKKIRFKNIVIYFVLVLISFIFFTMPVYKQYPNMFGWFFSLFTHSGIYGQGEKNIIDFNTYFFNVKHILTYNIFFSILFFTSIIVFFYIYFYRKKIIASLGKPIYAINLALFITALFSCIVIAKTYNGKNYYLIVPYSFLALSFISNGIIILKLYITNFRKVAFFLILLFLSSNIILNFKYYENAFKGWKMSENEIEELNLFLAQQRDYILINYNNFSINKPQAFLFGHVFSKVHLEKLEKIYPSMFYFNLIPNQFSVWLKPFDIKTISNRIFLGDTFLQDNDIKALRNLGFEPVLIFSNRTKAIYELKRINFGFKNKNLYQKLILQEIHRIKNDNQWFLLVKGKALKNNISLDSMLYLDAKWMIDNYYNTDTIQILEKMEEIKSDSIWYNLVKEKALKQKISIDSMLYLDAKYSISSVNKNK